METQTIENKYLLNLNCALGSKEDSHLCKDPITLSCGHYTCKSCINQNEVIKCNNCNQVNERTLDKIDGFQVYNELLEKQTNEIYNEICEKFSKTFSKCKHLIHGFDEKIESHVDFIKDELRVRIESMKNELDELYDSFEQELDEIKNKWKLFNDGICPTHHQKLEIFENQLSSLLTNNSSETRITPDHLYQCQNQIRSMQKMIDEYNNLNNYKVEFRANYLQLDRCLVGKILFKRRSNNNRQIIEDIKHNKYETLNVGYNAWDLCEIGDMILLTSASENYMILLNSKMEIMKRIETIGDRPISVVGAVYDEIDNVFLVDWGNHLAIKTDLKLNQLTTFGSGGGSSTNHLFHPSSICYYNSHVYICDFSNKRIQKLTSNLTYSSTFTLNYRPWYIKNINNVAIVRANSEKSIYFYDLNDFTILKTYDGHNGIIGISRTRFYEYHPNNRCFYCYNENGELCEQYQTNGFGLRYDDSWGSITVFQSKLYLTCGNNSLFSFG